MYRSYCPDAQFSQPSVSIHDSHEVHHLKDVLRIKKGDVIEVFNAHQQMAKVKIDRVGEGEIVGVVESVKQMQSQGARIILACAIPKRSTFEDIIEKATELGVDEIVPMMTKRTEVIITPDKVSQKLSRFNKIAVASAKQCARGQLPKIHPPMGLDQALIALEGSVKLFSSLHGNPKHIREALAVVPNNGSVAIFIGPEGDFTAQELDKAIKAGCQPVHLGSTVLRVATAAITSVALARYLLRD